MWQVFLFVRYDLANILNRSSCFISWKINTYSSLNCLRTTNFWLIFKIPKLIFYQNLKRVSYDQVLNRRYPPIFRQNSESDFVKSASDCYLQFLLRLKIIYNNQIKAISPCKNKNFEFRDIRCLPPVVQNVRVLSLRINKDKNIVQLVKRQVFISFVCKKFKMYQISRNIMLKMVFTHHGIMWQFTQN